jgi:hypothetical protein
MDLLSQILERHGIEALFAAAAMYWTATRVIEPLVTAHTQYLATTAAAFTRLAESSAATTAVHTQQLQILERLPCAAANADPAAPANCPNPGTNHDPRS